MNKKVGLVTLYGESNFGNKLQNYAVIYVLKKYYSFETETLIQMNSLGIIKDCLYLWFCENKNRFLNRAPEMKREYLRKKKFESFSKKYLNTRKVYSTKKLSDKKDYFVVGSDQVWNTEWYTNERAKFNLLSFSSPEKRVSFSPSIGLPYIDASQIVIFKEELGKYKYLSCREYEGSKILEQLVNKNVYSLIDPTLVLTKNEWDVIRLESEYKPKTKYLLGYFLEDISIKKENRIIDYCKKNDLIYINILDKKNNLYVTGPSEFIDLIADCSYFVTDSFHGVIFSILFQKEFSVICGNKRKKMKSRLDTILEDFGLIDRWDNELEFNKNSINYDEVNAVLEKKREEVFKYLDLCFDKKAEKE